MNENTGMVMNIAVLKKLMQKILNTIDHKFIDKEVDHFKKVPSTAENLAAWFSSELSSELEKVRKSDDLWSLESVTVHETEKNIATVTNE